MLGTWINTGTVIAGSLIGLAVGDRLPERIRRSILTALGLVTLGIGVQMTLRGTRLFLIIGSLIAGGILGEWIGIERALERFAAWLQARVRIGASGRFVQGFVTASLLFCVGPMTVVGAIEDGVTGDASLLVTKSVMDGLAAMALSATTGIGVLFAAGTVLVVQGPLTLLGGALSSLTEPAVLDQFSAVGGLIILGLGIRLLGLKEIPIANYLPALVIVAAGALWL
ncbi:MAG TPA: DUF554 domain-containing protein [Acidobacteriota bacterium]|nr:DUF554 domain-containing protein [Acidobacteriota bacterium]